MKKQLLTIVLLLYISCSQAQQEFMFTHYMFNGLAFNPSYAGVHEGLSTSFLYRNQWVGFEGAPNTAMASVNGPISQKPASLGVLIFRDQLGISTEFGSYFSYAYRIPITSSLKLSIGLQMNLHSYSLEYSRAADGPIDPGDVLGDISELKWNFGAGLLIHNDRFYLGLSSPQVLNKKLDIDDPDGNFSQLVRHYYFSAGYAWDLAPDLVLKPNVLVKALANVQSQVDLNVNLLIKSALWVGLSYRSLESLDGIVGFQITPQILVSYAMDFTLNEIDMQSYEIMVNYIFELPNKKVLTPRYF